MGFVVIAPFSNIVEFQPPAALAVKRGSVAEDLVNSIDKSVPFTRFALALRHISTSATKSGVETLGIVDLVNQPLRRVMDCDAIVLHTYVLLLEFVCHF
jgi:hypothetical protein